MRIHIPDPTAREELHGALSSAGCAIRPHGRALVLVGDEHDDLSQTLLSATFFVRAWQMRNPGVELEIM